MRIRYDNAEIYPSINVSFVLEVKESEREQTIVQVIKCIRLRVIRVAQRNRGCFYNQLPRFVVPCQGAIFLNNSCYDTWQEDTATYEYNASASDL